jgi:hypothetical protein
LENYLQYVIRYRPFKKELYLEADPPLWGDAAQYISELAKCKYYIGGEQGGAGQGLVEAASLGLICFGEQSGIYHTLVCHPACLLSDLGELPQKFHAVVNNPLLHEEIIQWQDIMLKKHFADQPLTMLQQALEMKQKSIGR